MSGIKFLIFSYTFIKAFVGSGKSGWKLFGSRHGKSAHSCSYFSNLDEILSITISNTWL
jgi:hypothetical protein